MKSKGKTKGGKPTTSEAARLAHDEIVGHHRRLLPRVPRRRVCDIVPEAGGHPGPQAAIPLIRGKPESWASGIVRVIGWINFLNDPSQPHHMKMSDIDERIGVSEATGSAKAKAIRKLLKVRPFDPEWTLPSRMDENPLAG